MIRDPDGKIHPPAFTCRLHTLHWGNAGEHHCQESDTDQHPKTVADKKVLLSNQSSNSGL